MYTCSELNSELKGPHFTIPEHVFQMQFKTMLCNLTNIGGGKKYGMAQEIYKNLDKNILTKLILAIHDNGNWISCLISNSIEDMRLLKLCSIVFCGARAV